MIKPTMSQAWKVGVYDCCKGSMDCANNKVKKLVDNVFAHYEEDKDEARDMLYDIIADREEDAGYWKYKAQELIKLREVDHDNR